MSQVRDPKGPVGTHLLALSDGPHDDSLNAGVL